MIVLFLPLKLTCRQVGKGDVLLCLVQNFSVKRLLYYRTKIRDGTLWLRGLNDVKI